MLVALQYLTVCNIAASLTLDFGLKATDTQKGI